MSIIYENYEPLANRRVYACRITVHTLGRQFEGDNSENHVTISFLLGNRQAVRADMKVQPGDLLEGQLRVSGQNFALSTSAITTIDIPARGCPQDFNPDGPPSGTPPTVQQFLSIIERLSRFKFLYVGGASDGCRYWVWQAMNASRSLLQSADALETASPSLWTLLNHKWDRSQEPRPWRLVPGLFLQTRDPLTKRDVLEKLIRADQAAIVCLANALITSREADYDYHQGVISQNKVQWLTALVDRLLCRRDWEATADLLSLRNIWEQLSASLIGRYAYAVQMIAFAQRLDTDTQEPTVFVLLLSAIVDISGEPDAEEA